MSNQPSEEAKEEVRNMPMSGETVQPNQKYAEHPDAKAAGRLFHAAERDGNWSDAKKAFGMLQGTLAEIEQVMGTLASLYGSNKPHSDAASVERIATAAIRLAEQVIALYGSSEKG